MYGNFRVWVHSTSMQANQYKPVSTHDIPVLLTSSVVAYDREVALKDTDERIRLTLESVAEWLKIRPTSPLVICDGSSYDFSKKIQHLFPNAIIECLSFENDQNLVEKYGRGYGEGEIVRYALAHSQFIKSAGAFAKCSAKLWVSNFQSYAEQWSGSMLCTGVFLHVFSMIKKIKWLQIDTRFYICSVNYYNKYFSDCHFYLAKENEGDLEAAFKKTIKVNNLRSILSRVYPSISGTGGGIGVPYKINTNKRKLKEGLRCLIISKFTIYKKLFVQI
jgi:hypothetical protein